MTTVSIVRGLPGAGKSTLAEALANATGALHIEADMYFLDDNGEYKFEAKKLSKAHEWCKSYAYGALNVGRSVVVSNTFTTEWEVEPYLNMAKTLGCKVQIIECRAEFESVHDVPQDTITNMRDRWENISLYT